MSSVRYNKMEEECRVKTSSSTNLQRDGYLKAFLLKNVKLLLKILTGSVIILFISLLILNAYLNHSRNYYQKLSESDKEKFNAAVIEFYGVEVKIGDILANDSIVYEKLEKWQIKEVLNGNIKEISKTIHENYKNSIFLTWKNMTKSLRNKFIKIKVNFQGKVMPLQDLINFDNKTGEALLQAFTSDFIRKAFEGKNVKIAEEIKENEELYVERYFVDSKTEVSSDFYINGRANTNNQNIKNSSEIIKEIEKEKIFLLVGDPGEGRSTTLRHLARKLKENSPEKWLQIVDLKKFAKTKEKFIGYLLSDILKRLHKINKFELFNCFFEQGQAILLWDSLEHVYFSSEIWKKIFQTKFGNIFLVALKPLKSEVFRKHFKLLPMGDDEKFEMVFKKLAQISKIDGNFSYDKNKGKNYFEQMKDLASLRNDDKLQKVIEKAEDTLKIKVMNLQPEPFYENTENKTRIENPLMLSMTSDMISDNTNLSAEINFYDFFESFVSHKIVKVGMNKVKAKVLKAHQAFAVNNIFAFDEKISKSLLLKNFEHGLSNEEISKVGILKVESDDIFEFSHFDFAKFFVTQFIVESFTNIDPKSKEFRLDIQILRDAFASIDQTFMNNYLHHYERLSDFFKYWLNMYMNYIIPNSIKATLPSPVIEDIFISKYLEEKYNVTFDCHSTNQIIIFDYPLDVESFLSLGEDLNLAAYALTYTSVFHGVGLFESFLDFKEISLFKNTEKKYLKKKDYERLLMTPKLLYCQTYLMQAALENNEEELKELWNYYEENFNEEEMKKALKMENGLSLTALQYSFCNPNKSSFLYVKKLYIQYLTNIEIERILQKYPNFVFNVIDNGVLETLIEVSKFLAEIFKNREKFISILDRRQSNGDSIYTMYANNCNLKAFTDVLKDFFNANEDTELQETLEHLKTKL